MPSVPDSEDKYKKRIFTIPNILSFLRICMIPAVVWLYIVKQDNGMAGAVLVLSGITDIVDGFIARRFNMISDVGKALDPIADKLTQGIVIICLVKNFPLIAVPLTLLIAKELFMAVTGIIIIKRTKKVMGAKWHGKAATFLLYLMMFVHIFWTDIPAVISTVLILLASVMIVVSFVFYCRDNIRALNGR